MLKNLVGGSPRSERAGKSPRAAVRKLRAVVESLKGRTMMSVALMTVAVSGVAARFIPTPAEATTVTSSRATSNLASPDAATTTATQISLEFPTPLEHEIRNLIGRTWDLTTVDWGQGTVKCNPVQVPEGKKSLLLTLALNNYPKLASPMTAYKLTAAEAQKYEISRNEPVYFSNDFSNQEPPTKPTYDERRHDYDQQPPAPNVAQFWVDFANKTLGGGVFGNGFVQEETMFLETPELANAAAQTPRLYTRTGTEDGPLDGSPAPLTFVGANRVMDIDEELTKGDKWRDKSVGVPELENYDKKLAKPEQINVLAMAAPKLPENGYKATPDIVKDLFNTFVAGFTLATTTHGFDNKKILINTGPIGAGAFKNNRVVVAVMQQLAARHVGNVSLKFWTYNKTELESAAKFVDPILTEFSKSTNKSISHLLVIAEDVMREIKVQ